jgi:CDP-ribitol ribitolphosphotransferase
VITDYSAVAFEASVMDVPVYFYVYDHDEYARDCGLNIDPLVEMAQVSSTGIGELADRIDVGATHPELMQRFKKRYASAPAGCAGRIASTILEAAERT